MTRTIRDNTSFAKRLSQQIAKAGMTQSGLSRVSGVNTQQICRYIAGNSSPRPDIFQRLATALGVSFLWLYSGEGERENKTSPMQKENAFDILDVVPSDPALRNAWFDGYQFAISHFKLNQEAK